MATIDFLAHKQPTLATVQALKCLHSFFTNNVEDDEFAFTSQLQQCRLDYSLNSLKRLDVLLDSLRTQIFVNIETFIQQPKYYNFLRLLAFYCGEVVGRARQQAPIWYDTTIDIAESPTFESTYAPQFSHAFICRFITYDNFNKKTCDFLPLVAIYECLFSDAPKTTLFASIAYFIPDDINPSESLPEPPPQRLAFLGKQALMQTPAHHLAYLQILPYQWILSDPLYKQMQSLGSLYQQGRVVWAALVQANNGLFEVGEYQSYPAEVVFDPSGRTDVQTLRKVAKRLFTLKGSQPVESDKAEYAEHITKEYTRLFGRVPSGMTHMPLCVASIFIWRPHLPNGILSHNLFPILITNNSSAVTVLPARYWQHTEFYQQWLAINRQTDISTNSQGTQETTNAFISLLEQDADFWHGYTELLYPQAEELPDLGKSAQQVIYSQPVNEDNQWFIKRCAARSQSNYRRFYEERPDEADIQNCMAQLQSGHGTHYNKQVQKYATLRLADFSELLAELSNEQYNQSLQQSALPKVAKILQQPQIRPSQTIKLIRYLTLQANKGLMAYKRQPNDFKANDKQTQQPLRSSTTAMLYLSYLYLVGKFVSQFIEEAGFWLNSALNMGDWRANRWVAEILLICPAVASDIWQNRVSSETSYLWLNVKHYSNSDMTMFDEQQHAYLQHRPAVLEIVRNQLVQASDKGHPVAQRRLQQLIDAQILPVSIPEERLRNAEAWMLDYLNQHTDEQYIISDDGTINSVETVNNTSWLSTIVQWGIIIGILYAVWRLFVADSADDTTYNIEPTNSSQMVAQQDSSTQDSNTQDKNSTADNEKTAKSDNPTTSAANTTTDTANLQKAVSQVRQHIPTTFSLDSNMRITGIEQMNNKVIIDITLAQEVMVSIQNAQSLFCYESLLQVIKQENPAVTLRFQRPNGEHFYDIDIQPNECR
ncbi:hypothetical protein [Psychrobacter sp. I-STPA10]|uniref:hypothetical protein n=1 Tax=Psychrobacter sp. I-STPA10 TaxID=2585769 RepID=UPI001E357432|nr:hypothetical protein [Psychrobacter sp. I-STPA10]